LKRKKKRCAAPRKAILAPWPSVIAGCDLTKYVNANGRKGPSVVAEAGVEDAVGEAGVELEVMTDQKTERGIMAGATEEEV
jgi:hypothetical protein